MTKLCQFCKSEIHAEAWVCLHCRHEQPLTAKQFFGRRVGFQEVIAILGLMGLGFYLYVKIMGAN